MPESCRGLMMCNNNELCKLRNYHRSISFAEIITSYEVNAPRAPNIDVAQHTAYWFYTWYEWIGIQHSCFLSLILLIVRRLRYTPCIYSCAWWLWVWYERGFGGGGLLTCYCAYRCIPSIISRESVDLQVFSDKWQWNVGRTGLLVIWTSTVG